MTEPTTTETWRGPHWPPIGIAIAIFVAVVLVWAWHGGKLFHHGSTSTATVAAAAGASSCSLERYYVENPDGSKRTLIYNCTIDNRTRCVTYENGIASDSTDVIAAVFANALNGQKPDCIGQEGS